MADFTISFISIKQMTDTSPNMQGPDPLPNHRSAHRHRFGAGVRDPRPRPPRIACRRALPDAVSHRHAFERFTRRAYLLDVEGKEIVEVDDLSGYEIRGGRRLVVAANEVHVFRGPRAFSQPEVEGQRSLENPTVWRGDGEAHAKPVEDDCLSQADERSSPITRSHE